jgi:hypothetical protein
MHEKYMTDSKALPEAAKPENLKGATKWEDWKLTFLNYLWSIPGQSGFPLKYICQEAKQPERFIILTNKDFLDNYITVGDFGENFGDD